MWGWVQRLLESGNARRIREARETLELRALESQLGLYGWDQTYGYNAWRDIFLRQPMGSQLVPPNLEHQGRGEMLPVYLNDYGLKVLRDLSRLQCRENEYAAGAIKMLVTLAVGEGMTYDCEGIDESTSRELIDAVQDVVDEFCERTHWPEMEQEAVARSHVDGECFIEWFPAADGTMDFRPVWPEWVRTPSGEGYDGRHSFGIETAHRDVCTVLGYHIVRDPMHGMITEYVEADHITHWKANSYRVEKRGLPTFYSVRENLERAEKLLRNTGILAQVAATFAVLREHSGTQAGATNMRDALTQSAGTDPRTGLDRKIQTFEPGGVIDHHQGVKYTISPANLQAEGYMTTHAAELRAVAASLCWPEYLVSADASNGNYSSLKVAESPTVKDSKRQQATWSRRFAGTKYRGKRVIDPPVMLRVVQWAVTCRRLPPEALTQVKVTATPPVLEVRDPIQTVSVQERRLVMGVTSRRAICTENGEDYEQVKRDLANEPETPEGGKAKGQTVKDSPGTDATAAPITEEPKGGSQDPDEEANGNGNGRMNGEGRDQSSAPRFPAAGRVREAGGFDAAGPDQVYDEDTAPEYAAMMAEVLYGLWGEDALKVLDQQDVQEGWAERAQEGKWTENLHPRGKGGKFIPLGSNEAQDAAKEVVADIFKNRKGATPENVKAVVGHLSILTVAQLRDLHAEHGVKVPGKLRQQIIDSLMKKLPKGKAPLPQTQELEKTKNGLQLNISQGKTEVAYEATPQKPLKGDKVSLRLTNHDNGNTYDVGIDQQGHAHCTCDGFKFAGKCKHAKAIADMAEQGKLPAVKADRSSAPPSSGAGRFREAFDEDKVKRAHGQFAKVAVAGKKDDEEPDASADDEEETDDEEEDTPDHEAEASDALDRLNPEGDDSDISADDWEAHHAEAQKENAALAESGNPKRVSVDPETGLYSLVDAKDYDPKREAQAVKDHVAGVRTGEQEGEAEGHAQDLTDNQEQSSAGRKEAAAQAKEINDGLKEDGSNWRVALDPETGDYRHVPAASYNAKADREAIKTHIAEAEAEEDKEDAERSSGFAEESNSRFEDDAAGRQEAADDAALGNSVLADEGSKWRLSLDPATGKYRAVPKAEYKPKEESRKVKAHIAVAQDKELAAEHHAEATETVDAVNNDLENDDTADGVKASHENAAHQNKELAKTGNRYRVSFDPETSRYRMVPAAEFDPKQEAVATRAHVEAVAKKEEETQDVEDRNTAGDAADGLNNSVSEDNTPEDIEELHQTAGEWNDHLAKYAELYRLSFDQETGEYSPVPAKEFNPQVEAQKVKAHIEARRVKLAQDEEPDEPDEEEADDDEEDDQ